MYQQTDIHYPSNQIITASNFFLERAPIFFFYSSTLSIVCVNPKHLTSRLRKCYEISPPAQGWTAAGGLWRSAPGRWLDRWRRSTAGSSWTPPSSQHRSPRRWGCTGPFSLSSGNGMSCLPLHNWRSGVRDMIRQMFRRITYKWTTNLLLKQALDHKKRNIWCRKEEICELVNTDVTNGGFKLLTKISFTNWF